MNPTARSMISCRSITALVLVLLAACHVHVDVHAEIIGETSPVGGAGYAGGWLFSFTDWVSTVNGRLTHVSFHTNPTAITTLKVYTLRYVSGTGYNIVGKSSVTGTYAGATSFGGVAIDTPLPVLPGDYLAFSIDSSEAIATLTTAQSTMLPTAISNGGASAGTCATIVSQSPRSIAAVSFLIQEQAIAAPFVGTTCPGGANGDPQFAGLQGQSFQVHGFADSYFNLISTPTLQMNGRFAYIANGECTQNYTECWTHPGTYIDHIGFQLLPIDGHLLRIELMAGAHTMKVIVNGDMIDMNGKNRIYRYHSTSGAMAGTGDMNTTETSSLFAITSIEYEWINFYTFHLQTNLWDITIYNSQDFFNVQVGMLNHSLMKIGSVYHDASKHQHQTSAMANVYPKLPIHGFIGNTWKNMKYENGKLYQGSVPDYETSGVFGVDFIYNHFLLKKHKHA